MSVIQIPKKTEAKHNKSGGRAPAVTDDASSGYSVFSKWIDDSVSPVEGYICLNATVGAAHWVQATLDSEDLGTAATKDVGTASDEVAAGDHNHDGSYLKPADVDDDPVDGVTVKPISSNWAYDKVVSDALELERLAGIDLTQNQLLYMYNHNTKLIDDCETTWTAYNAGTIADETTIVKIGTNSQKITADADTKGAYRTVSLDLTKFGDGASSTTDDFIQIPLYILTQDITDLGSATIRIAFYDGTNEWYKAYAAAGLANGWNLLQIPKSDFTGTADWSAITTIRSYVSGTPDAEVIYYLDDIQLIRKDPTDAKPNPFQIENDGTMERVMEVSSGVPFLGYDGTTLVIKGLNITNLISSLQFSEVFAHINTLTNSTGFGYIFYYYNDNNYIRAGIANDYFYSQKSVAGTDTDLKYIASAVSTGDEVSMYLSKSGQSFYAKADNLATDLVSDKDAGYTNTGEIRITLREDASLTSFKASSKSSVVNK